MYDTDQISEISEPPAPHAEVATSGRFGLREAVFTVTLIVAVVATLCARSEFSAPQERQENTASASDREQFNQWVENLGLWNKTD